MGVSRWLWATTAIGCCVSGANAQGIQPPPRFSLVAVSARAVEADPGSTVSIVLSVQSVSPDSLRVVPSLLMPDGWSVVTGFEAFSLAPRRTDTWIMSVLVPSRAESARYFLQVRAGIRGADSLESRSETIQVDVRRRRGLALALVKQPEYVVAGSSYVVEFSVRNRGNGPADIRLAAQSLVDAAPIVDARAVRLRADEDTTVRVRVRTPVSGDPRPDDLVQLSAAELVGGIDASAATASANVIIVQPAGAGEPRATIPTRAALRAASAGAGVSPFEIVGRGKLRPDRDETIDFVFHGKSGLNSAFGDERDNRLEMRTSRYRARLGDNVFASSSLTGMGQIGFGAGLDFNARLISGGAYSQRFRYTPGEQSEQALNLAVNPGGVLSGYRASFNVVERSGGPFAGKVFSTGLRFPTLNAAAIDAELAGSGGPSGRGYAKSVRVTGGRSVRYDLGHVSGDSIFAGPTRNSRNDYSSVSLPATTRLQINGSINRSRFGSGADSTLPRQEFVGATIGAVYDGRFSLEYSALGRTIGGDRWRPAEAQRFGKARIDQSSPLGSSWLSLEMGGRGDTASNGRTYHLLQLGTSVNQRVGSLSVYSELYDGGSLTRGLSGMTTLGGNASARFTANTTLSVFGYMARNHVVGARPYSQLDARLTRVLGNGTQVSVRFRSATITLGKPTERIGYVEYNLPFGVPTGHVVRPGRASGTVTDGESGKALPGVLVRLGPRAEVTDRNGTVTFAGLAPGEYRASLGSDASLSNAAYLGNPIVKIDSARREVTSFRLAVSRAASIRGTVRLFSSARTAFGAETDSLEYSGRVSQMTIALAGASDTVYRTTDADGQFSFDAIPSGPWTIFVDSDVASGFLVERPQAALTLRPGEDATIDFRVVPKRKRVKLIAQ